MIELVRHSFSARMVEAAGLAPHRLELFTTMARQVPMRRLTYPSGFEHLARVRQAILDDLEALVQVPTRPIPPARESSCQNDRRVPA